MSNKSKKIIFAFLHFSIFASLLTSCVEEYNIELPTSESNLLVVEGSILSDSVSTFYLSLTMPVNSTEGIKHVKDATIQLKGTDGVLVDGTQTADGTYQIRTPKLDANAKYNIIVKYNGDTYESDPQTPYPSLGIKNVEASQLTETSDIDILITTDVPANTSEIQYYRWTYKETWELVPELKSSFYWDPEKQMVEKDFFRYPQRGWKYASSGDIIASSSAYYSNNQIVQYKLYDIDRSDRRLYVLYSTDVCQRSLTKAEYEYETERKKISTDMGGLFTPQPSALPTNIHCTTSSKRALGYVGCSLNTKHFRIFASPQTLSVKHKYECDEISNTDEDYPGEQKMYESGYLVSNYLEMPGVGTEIDWASPSCVDIRFFGCDTTKPTYWPY